MTATPDSELVVLGNKMDSHATTRHVLALYTALYGAPAKVRPATPEECDDFRAEEERLAGLP